MFERRAARAALLAKDADAAREPLEFATALSRAQAQCADRLQPVAFTGSLTNDIDKLVTLISAVLEVLADRSEEARQRIADSAETARTRLLVYWNENSDDYVSRALLQPYVAALRDRKINADRVHSRGHCPFCGGAAWISARKSTSEADSGFRYLGCSLCGLEWNFNRIACPACGEEDPHKLPIFQNDTHRGVRIETCDTCRRYVKSIDMTLDARPIPPVDDLVSLSMDLWAIDEGFTRIEPGMAGI